MEYIFADIIIWMAVAMLLLAAGLTVYSLVRSLKKNRRPKYENRVPAAKIAWLSAALVAVTAAVSLLVGSLTDMFIATTLVLLAVASGAVIIGSMKSLSRKRAKNNP
jgi:amino acid transporter